MSIIQNIINQHFEESSFNWLLRNSALSEPQYELPDLAHQDDRVEANLDGLRIANDSGWEICQETMSIGEPGEIFTACVLAFESLIPERMDAVLAAVEFEDDLKRALVSALGWIDFKRVTDSIQKLLYADLNFLKYIGLAANAVHRRDPGAVLRHLLEHEDPLVRTRALKASGELGRLDLLPLLISHLREKEDKCRFYSAWSAGLLGDGSALPVLKAFAEAAGDYAQRACDLIVRKMTLRDVLHWLANLAEAPTTLRTAIWGYGALGDPGVIPWLLEIMQVPEMARPAGEAFSMITGVDLDYDDLETDPPEDFAAGPTEDPADEDVDLDPDEDLPWPDPELIARWWNQNSVRFKKGVRHLVGKPISEDHLENVLRTGYQRQRAAAAIELSLLRPGTPLFEVRAPGFRQKALLGMK